MFFSLKFNALTIYFAIGRSVRFLCSGTILVFALLATGSQPAHAAPSVAQCKSQVSAVSAPFVTSCSCSGTTLIVNFTAGPNSAVASSPICGSSGSGVLAETRASTFQQLEDADFDSWSQGNDDEAQEEAAFFSRELSGLKAQLADIQDKLWSARRSLRIVNYDIQRYAKGLNNIEPDLNLLQRYIIAPLFGLFGADPLRAKLIDLFREKDDLNRQITQLQRAERRIQAEIRRIQDGRSNFALAQTQTDFLANMGTLDAGGSLSFKTSLADLRKRAEKERSASPDGQVYGLAPPQSTFLPGLLGDTNFNAWINGAVSFRKDGRSGVEASGDQFMINAGASYRINEHLLLGGKLRYRESRSRRKDGSASSSVDGIGGSAYAKIFLPQSLVLSPLLAYERTHADVTSINGATTTAGDFRTNITTYGVGLSKRIVVDETEFDRQTFWEPDISVSHVTAKRGSFTDSTGTLMPSSTVNQGNLKFSSTFGVRLFEPIDNVTFIQPTLSLMGTWNFNRPDGFFSSTGSLIEPSEFTAGIGAGVTMQLKNGASISLNTTHSGLGSKVRSTTISGRVTIPLGG